MEQMKTKTMAEIYLKQGHLQDAYEIFKALADKDPEDREVEEKLGILGQRLGLVTPSIPSDLRSKNEILQTLQKWLANIQARRMK